LAWRWDADPFGTAAPNQNPAGLGTFLYNLRFPGQYYQAETGLNYNYHRDYDPLTGRYVESDPIGLRGGANTYVYVYDTPVRWIDRHGLIPGWSDPSGPPDSDPGNPTSDTTTYYGGEFHFFLGGGLSSVRCKDSCGKMQTFRYAKVCVGGAVGGGLSTGVVGGMSGVTCNSDRYAGWFYELGGSLGPLAGGADDGFNNNRYYLPTGRSGVSEVGIGLGFGFEFKSTWCYYVPLQ
jgi:RHS repeat-associated protein